MSDLIYRQMAIDAMLKLQAEDDEAYGCRIPEGFDGERAKKVLETLPSAQPERKKGTWIYDGKQGRFPACKCSVCGHYENADWTISGSANYCPNCGADMRGGEI